MFDKVEVQQGRQQREIKVFAGLRHAKTERTPHVGNLEMPYKAKAVVLPEEVQAEYRDTQHNRKQGAKRNSRHAHARAEQAGKHNVSYKERGVRRIANPGIAIGKNHLLQDIAERHEKRDSQEPDIEFVDILQQFRIHVHKVEHESLSEGKEDHHQDPDHKRQQNALSKEPVCAITIHAAKLYRIAGEATHGDKRVQEKDEREQGREKRNGGQRLFAKKLGGYNFINKNVCDFGTHRNRGRHEHCAKPLPGESLLDKHSSLI